MTFPPTGDQPEPETLDDLRRALAEARAEVTVQRDRYLRCLADSDNFRKRVERQAADQVNAGRRALLGKVLGVMDNLDRALRAQTDGPANRDGLATGLRLTYWQFMQLLQQEGLREIPTVGKPFDPKVHEAVDTAEADDQPEGTVLAETLKGYWLGDDVLRPARVVVSVAPRPSEGAQQADR